MRIGYNACMSNKIIVLTTACLTVVTIIFGAMYALVQQDIRQSANDPQIAMAEDAASALAAGGVPASVVSRDIIDASVSLLPFVMVFDENGTLLESSMKTGNSLPVPPKGVFDFTRSNTNGSSGISSVFSDLIQAHSSNIRPVGEDRITWQTASGLRFATVIVHWSSTSASISTDKSGGAIPSGFVLVGRSLREIEQRESQLEIVTVFAWFVSVLCIIVSAFIFRYLSSKKYA